MSSIDPARLSAFIASRICHDLVSPISSVTNALDLMDEPGDHEMKAQAESLLHEGAEKAAARIQFLRYAFGSIGLNSGAADIHEAKKITEAFVRSHRPSVDWDIRADHLSFSHVRLMMNLVMLGTDALPRGGVVNVRVRNEAGGLTMVLTCKGDRAKLKPDVAAAITGDEPSEGWRPETIQPYFARMICDGLDGELTGSQGEDQVIFMATGIRAEG
ncbi:MAG: histidine phosphotransferase family protein [Hyphomonas sp.]|uniref:histidine phosphotransferase family protein n=1 Tax=Hyphomonas sp. TaxID=87 RepID=UPI00352988F3